jgi:hypothetical protein
MNKIMLKVMNWTKKCNNIERKKMRNKREHKISGFPCKITLDSSASRLLHVSTGYNSPTFRNVVSVPWSRLKKNT